jgi:hypothetical protein
MAAVYVDRRAFVSAFLSANPRCQFPECAEPSRDVHEVIRRSHGSALYPGQAGKRVTRYLGLCRAHHDWISVHPLEARALGLDER